MAAAAGKAAAVNVEDDRQLVLGCCVGRGPDVQEQAVLAVSVSLALAELVVVEGFSGCGGFVIEGAGLVAAGTVLGGIIDTVPVGDGDGELPPPGGGVANALVSGNGPATGKPCRRSRRRAWCAQSSWGKPPCLTPPLSGPGCPRPQTGRGQRRKGGWRSFRCIAFPAGSHRQCWW